MTDDNEDEDNEQIQDEIDLMQSFGMFGGKPPLDVDDTTDDLLLQFTQDEIDIEQREEGDE